MNKRTGLLTDPIYMTHRTGMHPEKPERLSVTLDTLKSSVIWNRLKIYPAKKADIDLIELVHDTSYIKELERQIASGREYVYSPDCSVSGETFEVALHASGGAISLIDHVLNDEIVNGFGLIRPPGHHAEHNAAMGFCYFNNIAICAEYLIQKKGIKRVLIMDFDVHHGNGTQHSFENRPDVFYCSVHESPMSCYPGTGFESDTGKGKGEGYTLNVAMNSGAGDHEYAEALEKIFLPAWEAYKPEFVLVSAGFDAHTQDPLANINITEESYISYTQSLCQIANTHCQGRLVSLLEGGYNLQLIPGLIESHISILLESVNQNS